MGWGSGQPADNYTFFHGNGNINHHLGTNFSLCKGIISIGYDIVPNVHAPTEDKIDDTKDNFYKELECVFNQFSKYHIKIMLGHFNAKVGREYSFKSTIRSESLHEVSNDNGVRIVNFTT